MHEIDFVVLWVDGQDLNWQEEFKKHTNVKKNKNNVLFRDWDNLHYIFRAFEQFTPWVHKIHFVTWGHLPKWFNADNPKVNIVNHADILNPRNLPVFNSNAIEPNIYKIKGLAEKFILFNDDFFITSPIILERFFKEGLPCDSYVSNALSSSSGVGHFVLNNLEVLNRNFNKKKTIQTHFLKTFNLKYGINGILRNIALLAWPNFTGFVDPHMPQPYLKSTFIEIWEKEEQVLQETSASRFRACSDVNQYLFRYWQLAKGEFVPVSMHDTKYVTLNMELLRSGEIKNMITSQQLSMLCLNDADSIQTKAEFEEAKQIIKDAFEKILPDKSSFEL